MAEVPSGLSLTPPQEKYIDIFTIGAVSLNHIYTHLHKIVNNIRS
jgi:hypothetical protein